MSSTHSADKLFECHIRLEAAAKATFSKVFVRFFVGVCVGVGAAVGVVSGCVVVLLRLCVSVIDMTQRESGEGV